MAIQIAAIAHAITQFAQTEQGQKLIETGKNLLVEVVGDAVENVSNLSWSRTGEETSDGKSILMSDRLAILDDGLSLSASFDSNQRRSIRQKISDDLDIVKGQNEILFLAHSIQYFVESHQTRVGIDRGISYALQYDIIAVWHHLAKNKQLRFPGYLLHQIISLSETIKDLNVFYVSLLQDGRVPAFEEEQVKEDLERVFGVENRQADIGLGYIPMEMKIDFSRKYAPQKDTKEKTTAGSVLSSFKNAIGSNDMVELNEEAHDSLCILKEELIANEQLEFTVIRKLHALPDKKLLIKSFTENNDIETI